MLSPRRIGAARGFLVGWWIIWRVRKAAEKLAAALEVGVDWLLTGDESKKRFPADKAMVDWLWQHPEVREELWERMKE